MGGVRGRGTMAGSRRAAQQVAVVGLGRFGLALASGLFGQGYDVLGIDRAEGAVQRAKDVVTHAVQAELSDAAMVRELGLDELDVAIVAIGSDTEASIFGTALLVEAGVPQVIARANSPLHGRILERLGAHRVVYPETAGGEAVARSVRAPGIAAYIALAPDLGVSMLRAPGEWVGRDLAGLRLPEHDTIIILAIQRGDETIAPPGPAERIRADDTLILLARDSRLGRVPGRRR